MQVDPATSSDAGSIQKSYSITNIDETPAAASRYRKPSASIIDEAQPASSYRKASAASIEDEAPAMSSMVDGGPNASSIVDEVPE